MPTLKLKTLTCFETDDERFDDAFLKVDGTTVWGPTRITGGQDQTIEVEVPFSTKASIELWDKDRLSKDDHLGTHNVRESEAGGGEGQARYHCGTARYRLTYEVV